MDRALALLDAFDTSHRRLGVSELARRSSTPLSTASRLAHRLEEWGALHRHTDGTYSVGLRLWEVASLAEPELELREIAAPVLDDLSLATRHEIQLAALEGHDALVLDRRRSRNDLPLNYRVGGRLPMVPTAVGLVLLALGAPRVAEDVLGSAFGWPLHECARPSAHEVRSHLSRIRHEGVAFVSRPTSPVASVAVPVRDAAGAVVAALGVVFPAGTAERSHLEPVLRTSSLAITRMHGATRSRPVPPPWRY